MKWNDDKTITITPPAKPKKITGTRFAAIMGLNKWTSPFNAWCAITRTYEEPRTRSTLSQVRRLSRSRQST